MRGEFERREGRREGKREGRREEREEILITSYVKS